VDPLSVLIFLLLLVLSGMFSGTETALTAISDTSVSRLAGAGHRRGLLLKRLMANRGRVIAALLVGNNIVNTVLAVFATVVFDGFIQDATDLPAWAGPALAALLAVVFLMVFGEVLPKTLAVATRVGWAMVAAYPVAVLTWSLAPVTKLLTSMSSGVLRALGRKSPENDIFDVHEIHAMAHLSAEAGVIDSVERGLIQRAAELNDTRVSEIMIPRTDIQAIEIGSSVRQIRALFQKTPFTRIPVYKGDLDDIIGILNFKEFFRHDPGGGRGFEIVNYLHKPLFVSGAMFIGDLLNELRAQRTHMAIVLDEYGGTAGLITIEDVVEMLVGRIDDEYDIVETPFEQIDERTWEVDGRVTDEQLVERLGLSLPPEVLSGFDTAAGLALRAFGNIPSQGDITTYHGLEVTAAKVKGHRVRRVRLRILPPHELEQHAEAGQSGRRKPSRPITPEGNGAADENPEALVTDTRNGG
jgi:putative hemolysin